MPNSSQTKPGDPDLTEMCCNDLRPELALFNKGHQ